MTAEFEHRKKVALHIAQYGGSLILDLYHTALSTFEKSPHDFVSELDKRIEMLAKEEIQSLFPNDSIIGEELPNISGKSDYAWVIDPIDGTNNYVRNIPIAGIQIAILEDNKVKFGVIFQPFLQELYVAERGHGSHMTNLLTGKKVDLRVGARGLSDSLLIFDSGIAQGVQPTLSIFQNLIGNIGAMRVFGCAVQEFPLIAKGAIDGLISSIANPYDIAAGGLIVEEAGGLITELNGNPWSIDSREILISTPSNQKQLLSITDGK